MAEAGLKSDEFEPMTVASYAEEAARTDRRSDDSSLRFPLLGLGAAEMGAAVRTDAVEGQVPDDLSSVLVTMHCDAVRRHDESLVAGS
jgi:hypothetical protein